jgi:hypothetical protein
MNIENMRINLVSSRTKEILVKEKDGWLDIIHYIISDDYCDLFLSRVIFLEHTLVRGVSWIRTVFNYTSLDITFTFFRIFRFTQ